MQLVRPTSEITPLSFKALIKRAVDEITQHWVEAVRADQGIPSAENLEEPLLLDAVPGFVNLIWPTSMV